jgi:hypothetical protein
MVTDRILEEVSRAPGCSLEDLVLACPELSWNQMFARVDTLSRRRHIRLTHEGAGRYRLWPRRSAGSAEHQPPCRSHTVRATAP